MCRRKVNGRGLVVALMAMFVMAPCLAEPKVPFESVLRKRVGQFYAACIKQDWPKLFDMIAPFVRRCDSPEDFRRGWTKDGGAKILSWRLVEITYDANLVGQEFKVDCSGQAYRVAAGASVTISQLDQEGEEKPKRGDNYLKWVLIDGVWFAVGPE